MNRKSLLFGDEIHLSIVVDTDIETIWSWMQDDTTLRLLNSIPAAPWTMESVSEWVKRVNDSKTDYLFGIRCNENGELIGYVEIDGIQWENRTCGMSYMIGDADQRGKGFGYQAVKIGLDFAFLELDLFRVQILVFDYNQVSLKLANKLGFVKEGKFRKHIARDGQRYDMHLFGLLQPEWVIKS